MRILTLPPQVGRGADRSAALTPLQVTKAAGRRHSSEPSDLGAVKRSKRRAPSRWQRNSRWRVQRCQAYHFALFLTASRSLARDDPATSFWQRDIHNRRARFRKTGQRRILDPATPEFCPCDKDHQSENAKNGLRVRQLAFKRLALLSEFQSTKILRRFSCGKHNLKLSLSVFCDSGLNRRNSAFSLPETRAAANRGVTGSRPGGNTRKRAENSLCLVGSSRDNYCSGITKHQAS